MATAVTSGSPSASIALSVGANVIPLVVTSEAGTTQSYSITFTRLTTEIQSSDSSLSDLTAAATDLTGFASGTTSYSVSVPFTQANTTVTPTVNDNTATVTVEGTAVTSGSASGTIAIPAGGTKLVSIVVTAEDGTTTTYSITFSRAAGNSNSFLSSMVLSGVTLVPTFFSGTASYTASVPYATATTTVTPTVNNSLSTVTVNGTAVTSGSASSAISLTSNATTTITTVVTAQDGSTTTYTVAIARAASTDATLSNLVPSAGAIVPGFDADHSNYFKSTTAASLRLTATTTNSDATLTIDGVTIDSGAQSATYNLTAGTLRTINVVVTAQSGTQRTYRVFCLRELSTSNNNYLSGLVGAGLTLKPSLFPDRSVYTAKVASLQPATNVTPTAAHSSATITVNGTAVTSGSPSGSIMLTDNALNAIIIVVTAENGDTRTYTINVTRGTIPSAAGDRSSLRRGLSRAIHRAV